MDRVLFFAKKSFQERRVFSFFRRRLSRTILSILAVSITMVLSTMIYLTVTHQTRDMMRETVRSCEEDAQVIIAGIKYPMSIGDSAAVQKQLLDIGEHTGVDVFICAYNERITFANRKEMIQSLISRVISDKALLDELHTSLKGDKPAARSSEETIEGKRYITALHPILNSTECHRCHGPERKVLGTVVVRKDVERNYAAVAELRDDNILMSAIGICAVAAIIFFVVFRLIKQPLLRLTDTMKEITLRIKEGDYSMRLDMRQPDEIGELIDSFNHMAEALENKNNALRKAHQEVSQANKELEAFAYSVSHDLRSPLRGIEGFSKILLDEYSPHLDEECKHYLSRIRCNTARMSALIDDILTLSRTGRTEIQKRPIHVSEILRHALSDSREEIATRGITVTVGDVPIINCDFALMQAVFSNLISNAIKFTRDTEHPEVTVGLDKEKAAIFVRDNGIGFDRQYHDKIFGTFQRLHLPEEYEGTGVGLAIVKRVVERHHGKIWAESEPGKGATFFLQLP